MSGRQAGLAVALVFAAAQVGLAQDHAVPRGGSDGGSSAGQGHHSGGASASGSDRGSDSGARSGGGSDSSVRYEPTDAQRRHPRAGTGTGGYQGGYYGGYYPSYGYGYYPYYYPYYAYGYYSPYYYTGFYGYAPAYHAHSGDGGAVRVIVEPAQTRVYVDGYYAGEVDDFDGIFQRLNLSPGRHEISLRLEGFRTQNIKVYVPYDHTIKIRHKMVPGAATDATDEIVVGRPEDVADPRRRYAEEGERREEPRYEPRDEAREEAEAGAADVPGDAGTLRLDVHPSDASIYVDGAFRGTARMRSLRLSPGRHRIEVVRPGYRTMEREVDVEPGREVELRFELDRS